MKTKHKPLKIKRKKKKKKKSPPRARMKKELASTYTALLNQAVQCMFQDKREVFTEEFDILWTSGFIEKGAKRGFRFLKNDEYQLDPDCNVVCLSNAIIMYGIIEEGEYHKLSHLQKLYLFFMDYLNRDGNSNSKKELPFEYAARKIDKKLKKAKAYHKKKVDEKAKAKSIKTALKSINKIEIERKAIKDRYDSWHKDRAKYSSAMAPAPPRNLRVNVCGETDCEFILENSPGFKAAHYALYGDVDISKVIEPFCKNMLYVFKGIIWLLIKEFSEGEIYIYSNGVDPQPSDDSNKVQINLPIHSLVENTNSVLIPSAEIYGDPDTYDDEEWLEEDSSWVYTNMKKNRSTGEYTMDKVLVDDLRDDTMYLTANLNIEFPEEMDLFIGGEDWEQPVLEYLQRTFKTLGDGSKVPQLIENIHNSISQHWYVAPRRSISDNVQIRRADEFLGAKKKPKKKKPKKKKKKKKPKKKTTRK